MTVAHYTGEMNYLQLDNIQYSFLRYLLLKRTVTLKVGLEVIQGHWK